MLGVIPEYARLLVWPARLFADYSPRQLMVYPGPDVSQVTGVALLLGAVILFVISVRRAPVVAFGAAWFALFIAPVSNVLLATGILVAERTLYLPSVGAVMALAAGVGLLSARLRADRSPLARLVPLLCAVLIALGVVRSSTRNAFWHDSVSAFRTMVDDAPLNFKAHYAWGGQLFELRKARDGELEWRIAIALNPGYHGVYMDLAHRYREAHLCPAALPLYRQALAVEPDLPLAQVSIAACQLEMAQYRAARTTGRVAIADGLFKKAFRYIIDRADSALVATDSIDPTIGAKWLARRK
jgi:tetratricopeptide (TPR) repeat protein